MNYTEWRDELNNNLLSVSESERRRVLDYYAEAYADRREAGFSEREIINGFGAPYDAAQRILADKGEDYGAQNNAPATPPPVQNNAAFTPPPPPPPRPAPQPMRYAPPPAPVKPKKKTARNIMIVFLIIVSIIVIAALVWFVIGLIQSLNPPEFETKRYEAQWRNTSLEVDFGAGKLKTEYYDGETILIEYPTANGYYSEISEGNGKLKFETKTRWFFFGIGKWDIPETVIYLPRIINYNLDFDLGAGSVDIASGTYGNVEIHVGAGSLYLGDSECKTFEGNVSAGLLTVNKLTCTDFEARVSAGKFEINELTCSDLDAKVSAGKLEVKTVECPSIRTAVSAGAAEIRVNGKRSEYNITSSVSAGSCNLSSQTGTTNKNINCKVSAGSIYITFTEE